MASEYDITGAFQDIEMELIKSMKRNMKRHIGEEFQEGINWTQWQAEMLNGLAQYKAENADKLPGYYSTINDDIEEAIRLAYATGESEQEIEILKAIQEGYKADKTGKGTNSMQGAFFRVNEDKLNSLITATTEDMQKAESAILRMTNDAYRQTIFKAQMYYNMGAGTLWQAVDMATKDFLSAGINCVEYKNGARVNIASYSEMALRTANKRANLMGSANKREEWGIHTVKVSSHSSACPFCAKWQGRVYIDDVYGQGTKEESKSSGYPLLSEAIRGNLFHPNCKNGLSTYYEGINQPPKEPTKAEIEEMNRRYALEQRQRECERNIRKYKRLENGSLDADNIAKYAEKRRQWTEKYNNLIANNADVLRADPARLKLYGITTKDLKPAIKATKKAVIHSETHNALKQNLDKLGVEYNEVKKHTSKLTEEQIIDALGGGDKTKGSCASVGLAYVGQKDGLNVLDFRGGESQNFFSYRYNLEQITKFVKEDNVKRSVARSTITAGNKLLKEVEEGKEYYFVCGRHASIVRKKDGQLQYLELQSSHSNGWTNFNGNPRYTLSQRFGCVNSSGMDVSAFMIDVDAFKDNEDFKSILGYINTAESKQKKGAGGYAK